MKKFLFFTVILIFGVLILVGQPTIPNGGFEQWTDQNTPTGWTTSNLNLGIVTYNTVTRSTDKHGGLYAIELKTLTIPMLGALPGIATNGTLNLMGGGTITGGTPTGGVKPQNFKGYFKYTSVNNDSMAIVVLFTKWTGTTRDTVGFGGILVNNSVSSYYGFNEPIEYVSTTTPDTFIVILASSAGYTPQENSTLLVDDLAFQGVLGETIPLSFLFQRIYPNPTNGEFTVILGEYKNCAVEVYNLIGEKIYEKKNLEGNTLIDISDKPAGIYFVKIESGKESKIFKLIKE
ncbi:MAG: T9SS type A sorting domain-containing protein [Bacteroidales bacterium]|nr:T9SS type A sorting domain-containing protein [Bacteroidales bacterium]